MFILVLIASIISLINAAAIVSRSQSYPSSQPAVLGPKTRLTIGNKVIAPDGFERSATLVDGVFPGPLIAAQKGDDFAIEVVNELQDESMFMSTSVHWHGLYQNGTNYADGASSVTQCPIAQNHSSLHTFSAPNQAGTYWYHSHYSVQYCDGLRGPLVIYDPHDPLAHMYDIDDASTVVTLSDWYHTVATVLRYVIGHNASSSLINGLGRYDGGPMSALAVITVEQGKRYRMRLISMSCDPNFQFSIDGHNLTVIEADGELTEPLLVDQLQIFAGQRYSVVLAADKPVDNYWIRNLPNTANASYEGGTNSAILRYKGAPEVEPATVNTAPTNSLAETNLHTLINPGAPGIPEYGKADINLNLEVSVVDGIFYVNNVTFKPPTVPVLLQILSGAQEPSQLLSNGSVIVLEANKVVELTFSTTGLGALHPRWKNFIDRLTTEWNGYTIYSTVMLAVDVSFFSIQSVQTQTSVTLLSVYPVHLGFVNDSRRRSAKDVASFMEGMSRSILGLESLALMLSLPFALLIWAMVFFAAALSVLIFRTADVIAISIASPVWFAILCLVMWLVLAANNIHVSHLRPWVIDRSFRLIYN